MPKVLIISPSLQMGGIEASSSTLANEFSRQGIDVHYFCVFKRSKFFYLNENIIIHEPGYQMSQRYNLISAPLRIRRLATRIKPDSILAFNKFLGALTLFSLSGLNYKIFISERASPGYRFRPHLEVFNNIIFKFLKPEGVISQTKFAYSIQQKKYLKGTRFRVINNALREISVFDTLRNKHILAVGRLKDPMKGFNRLIEAFSMIKNNEWNLIFAGGDSSEGAELLKKSKKISNHLNIHFIGKIKNIDKFYAESGIFVLPSISEGFPNALVEAMSAGLPCIGFRYNSGITEIIEDGYNGILVENGNIPALAKKLDFLIENEAERTRLGNNARKIKEKLAIEHISAQYLDFILPN